jgi:hypothetical protein
MDVQLYIVHKFNIYINCWHTRLVHWPTTLQIVGVLADSANNL